MARTRGSRTPRNWAEHQDRHRAGCEPAPAILSSGQSVRQRSKIAFGISSHVTVALLPSCKEAGFEAPPIPLAIQSHWMNSSTADERAGPSGVAPMSVGGTRAKLNGGQSQFAFAPVVQTSTCSAMARASSTSMPRYRTVLSILVCPNSNCTARKLPVRPIYERRFGPSKGVRSEEVRVEVNRCNPARDEPSILPSGHAAAVITTATEQKFARLLTSGFDLIVDGLSRLLRQLKPDGPTGLPLPFGSPPREKSVRSGLAAGGRWIRTSGSARQACVECAT